MEQQQSDKLDFEKIWLLFQETDRQFKETDKKFKETDKKFKETDKKFQLAERETSEMKMSMKDMFQEIRDMQRESDRQFQEMKRRMDLDSRKTERKLRQLENLFTGQWGKLVESLVQGRLVELFLAMDIQIKETYLRAISDRKDMEIDIVVANGADVVAVEVKTTLRVKYIDDFIVKLSKFKDAFIRFSSERLYGAVAYLRDEASAARYAESLGLYVIRATGDSARIVNSSDFKPRIW